MAVARDRQSRGESVTAIARHLKIGRPTLYRALQPHEGNLVPATVERARARYKALDVAVAEIARALGVGRGTIYRALQQTP